MFVLSSVFVLYLLFFFCFFFVFFFFQAEDGIRDADVTGVQTCALPIYIDVFSIEEDESNSAFINYLHITNGAINQAFTFEYKKKLNESKEELLTLGDRKSVV